MTAEEVGYEWAIRVHCLIRDIPGPHILDCSSETVVRHRFTWWQANRPDASPELLRRTVTVTRSAWQREA